MSLQHAVGMLQEETAVPGRDWLARGTNTSEFCPLTSPQGVTSPGQAQTPTLALGRRVQDHWAISRGCQRSSHLSITQHCGKVAGELVSLQSPWSWQQGPQGHPYAAGDGAESGDMALLLGLALDVPLPLGSPVAQRSPGWWHPPGLGVLEPVGPLIGSALSTRMWHDALEVGRGGDAWSGPYSCCCKKPSPLQGPSPSGGIISPARTISPTRTISLAMTISPTRSHLPCKSHPSRNNHLPCKIHLAFKHHLLHKDHLSFHDHPPCKDHLPLNDHFPFNDYSPSKTISL